jgi:uncharacterized protein (DUF1778 family)
MAKRGPKALEPGMARDQLIAFRLREEDYKRLKAAAAAIGVTVSSLIRDAALRASRQVPADKPAKP